MKSRRVDLKAFEAEYVNKTARLNRATIKLRSSWDKDIKRNEISWSSRI